MASRNSPATTQDGKKRGAGDSGEKDCLEDLIGDAEEPGGEEKAHQLVSKPMSGGKTRKAERSAE